MLLSPCSYGLWELSTKDRVHSTDRGEHLEEIFKLLDGKEAIFERYHKNGYEMYIFAFWCKPKDEFGGGPLLTWQQAQKLPLFKLDIWFDVYE